ncbi:MAG TPA: cytidylate kinase family protein, partial [Chloroflexota bacterium]|nr:cytidylate kinase family protein [Chloroflexota bacterium]
SEGTGIPVQYFEALDERGRSMWRRPADLVQLVPLPPINPDLPDVFGDRYPPTGPVRARGEGLQSPIYWASEAYAAAISRTIQSAVRVGGVVLVGRGGNEALNGIATALNVLVMASDPIRVRRLADLERVNDFDALDLIKDSDRRRREYIRQFFGADWLDPSRYDLVIRTDHVSYETAAEIIVTAARRTLATSTSTPAQPAEAVHSA